MATCDRCGQERGESLASYLHSIGFRYLEHCELSAIYRERIIPCVGAKYFRQCNLCPIGRTLGQWTPGRTGASFAPYSYQSTNGTQEGAE